ncbi:MAG: carbon storage regulator [Planctomycetaceae bacterium]
MLVLTRKRSEMIHIGEQIVVKVIQTGRGSVKLGIDAPKAVRVLRAELCPPVEAGHPLAAYLRRREEQKLGVELPEAAPAPAIRIRPR